jgi:hypothetical protein
MQFLIIWGRVAARVVTTTRTFDLKSFCETGGVSAGVVGVPRCRRIIWGGVLNAPACGWGVGQLERYKHGTVGSLSLAVHQTTDNNKSVWTTVQLLKQKL